MKRLWPIVALILVAAAADESNLLRVAQATFKDGIYDLAERQCREFLAAAPNSEKAPEVQLMLGQALVYQGKWSEALKVLEDGAAKWTEKQPDSFQFWIAEALVRGEKFAEAEKRYSDVIARYTTSTHLAAAYYGLAYAQFKHKALPAATATLEQLAKVGPKGDLAAESGLLRGQVFLAQQKFTDADKMLRGVIEQFPQTRTAYRARLWLGESLTRQSRFDDALKEYVVITDSFAARQAKPATTPAFVDPQLAAEAWFGTGWAWWHQEKFEEAANGFSQALAIAPSDTLKRSALLKLAEANVRGGRLTEGVARLTSFLESQPGDPLADEVQLAIAELYFDAKNYARALPEYTTLTTNYPTSKLVAQAHFNSGWCAYRLGEVGPDATLMAQALKSFTQAFELTKDKPGLLAEEALFKVGDVHFALSQYKDAITRYQQLISSFPKTKLLDRALFQLGQAYQRTRNAEAATASLESLIEQAPDSAFAAEAQFLIGWIQVGLEQEEQARAAFAKVSEKFGSSEWAVRAQMAIGESLYREGKYDEAAAQFDKLIADGPETVAGHRAFYNRGWCQAQQGQAEKTLTEFSDFLKAHPASVLAPEIQFWIAGHYAELKNYLKAQEQFQLIAGTYTNSPLASSALYLAGRAAYTRQDYKGAIELYEALLKQFPASPWRCDARFGQGDALTELGQFDNALLVFDTLIKDFPDCYIHCEAIGRKGDCLFTLSRFEEAVASFRTALSCAPEDDSNFRNQLHYKLGQSYDKLTRLDDAFAEYGLVVYESAVAPVTNMPPERFWLSKTGIAAGDLKERQQQWKEAIKLYERLMILCPDLKPILEERIRKIRVERFIFGY